MSCSQKKSSLSKSRGWGGGGSWPVPRVIPIHMCVSAGEILDGDRKRINKMHYVCRLVDACLCVCVSWVTGVCGISHPCSVFGFSQRLICLACVRLRLSPLATDKSGFSPPKKKPNKN